MGAVWFSGGTALALFTGLAWYLAPLHPSIVVLQLAFDAQSFGGIVHAWSPEQLQRYRLHLWIDFALMVSYAAFGCLLVMRSQVFSQAGARWRTAIALLLPLAAVFDVLENIFHLWLTEVPRFGVRWIYPFAATCSSLKWLLFIVFGLCVAIALTRTGD
jgi:hypothetical protein